MRAKLAAWVMLGAVLGGCESDCNLVVGCPAVNSDRDPDDFSARLGGSLFAMSANGHEWVWLLRGGEVVFTTEPRDCDFLTTDCRLTLKRLEYRFGDMDLDLTDGTELVAKDIVLRLETPVETTSTDNINFSVPAGGTFQTCATINGERMHGEAPAGAIRLYVVRYPSEGFSVAMGETELVLHAVDDGCQEIRVKVGGSLTGYSPPLRAPDP